MEPKSEPRRNKKREESEVKLRELSEALEAKKKSRVAPTSPLGGEGETKTAPRQPQEAPVEASRKFSSPLKLPKALLTSLHFSSLFVSRLSSLLGSILAPSWAPFWPNFGPSRLLKPYLFHKR